MKTSVFKFTLMLLITGFILNSCDSGITYPPVTETPTGVYHPGQFVWHDLATPNPNAAMKFYTDVFGWEYKTLGKGDQTYHVIYLDGKPIGGIFKLAPKYGNVSEWISSVSVTDVGSATAFNTSQGGKTIFKPFTFKGRGETALVQDPQGAIIAFIHAKDGDPPFNDDPKVNSWLWNELWTNDLDASIKYYSELFGFSPKSILGSKIPYSVFEKDGHKLSGVLGNPVKESRSSWMPYVRVNDVSTTYKKAVNAGAKSMMEPNSKIRNGNVAVLLDPLGAQFTIQKWPIK